MALNNIWVHIPNRGNIERRYLTNNIERAREEKHLYTLKSYREVYSGVSHAHCEVCWRVIADENNIDTDPSGYHSNDTWVCQQCFVLFIEPEAYVESINKLEVVPRPK
jgi:hypothetical protein